MNNYFPRIFLLIFFSFFTSTGYAFAADISIGASSWLAWWEPRNSENDMNLDPTILYGPVASAKVTDDLSISGVFLYGKFKSKTSDGTGGPDEISRFDSDLSVNYNLNRYLKIFAGAKYMGFAWDEKSSEGTHSSTGPGLGIGSTIPLLENFYLLANISGTYSWGEHTQRNIHTNNNISQEHKESVDIRERSFNSNLSIAYYIKPASTTISLGGRYQYFYIDYAKTNDYLKDEVHNFFGITLAAVYSFVI